MTREDKVVENRAGYIPEVDSRTCSGQQREVTYEM